MLCLVPVKPMYLAQGRARAVLNEPTHLHLQKKLPACAGPRTVPVLGVGVDLSSRVNNRPSTEIR